MIFFIKLEIFNRDISSTSIVHLPAAGLATMEILRAQNTITMKTVPSIHDFKVLLLLDTQTII